MKVQILITIALVNFLILIGRSSAQEAQAEPVISTTSEATPVQPDNVVLTSTAMERSGHAHDLTDPTFKGFWAKKFAWRPRWVKTWQEKKVYVAVWKRMWGPIVVKEWVPVPKPPPGWVKHDAGSYIVKKFPHH